MRALAVASFHTLSRTEMLLLRASLRRLLLGNSRGSLRPNFPLGTRTNMKNTCSAPRTSISVAIGGRL